MLTSDQINDLHRLYVSEKWPIRKIERHLNMGWKTIKKYLETPAQGGAARERRSKLDPFKAVIAECLEKDPCITAALILQQIKDLGYSGSHAILQEYVRKVRPQPASKRAFVRMEPFAGERFEVDWAHFDVLNYSGDLRKLYAFALIDAHSRMLYVEFTHSQSFETFARCHVHAFHALQGVAREIVYDNLATAVAEHDGRLVRFLPRFLGSPASTTSSRGPAIQPAAGRKARWNALSVISGKTSGPCGSSKICRMPTGKCANGWQK
jgi:transposase